MMTGSLGAKTWTAPAILRGRSAHHDEVLRHFFCRGGQYRRLRRPRRVSASSDDGMTAWNKNSNGAGNNSGPQRITTTQFYYAYSIAGADIDGDGDADVLSGFPDDDIAWYDNLDGGGELSRVVRVITS